MKTGRVKPTTPDLVILALLAEHPMHGYEIIQELNYRDARDWVEISKPQIYYSLEKLHRNKFIASASDQEAPSGPDRQTFRITTLGRKSLNEGLKSASWTNQRPPTPFQTWMALSSQLSTSERKTLLAARLAFVEKQLTKERETLKAIRKDEGSMTEVAGQMVDLFIRQAEVEHRWLSEILNGIKS